MLIDDNMEEHEVHDALALEYVNGYDLDPRKGRLNSFRLSV